jgi:hypothetical protein
MMRAAETSVLSTFDLSLPLACLVFTGMRAGPNTASSEVEDAPRHV